MFNVVLNILLVWLCVAVSQRIDTSCNSSLRLEEVRELSGLNESKFC
jgi:hypothetical protein